MSKRRKKNGPKGGVTGWIWEFSNKDSVPHVISVRKFFCGFPVISSNHNQLWLWKSLENV